MMKKITVALAVLAALSVMDNGPASAAPVASDSLAIIGPGGTHPLFGVVVTDAQESACGTPTPNLITNGQPFAGGCLFGFNPLQIAANLSLENQPTFVFEPDGLTLSDVFGVYCLARDLNGACTSGTLAFISDINGQPIDLSQFGDISNDPQVYEDGTLPGTTFDATAYLDPALQDQGYTAKFTSRNDTVPEPATLALLGAGVTGLAAMRRRRKKAI